MIRSKYSLKTPGLPAAAALCLGLALATGCSKEDAGGAAKSKPVSFPVEAMAVQARKVEYSVEAVGSVDAFERVEVSAKVEGVVEKVRFTEGDRVKAGDILVEVEPERFRLAANAAKAEYSKADAGRRDTENALARRNELQKTAPDIISEEDLDALRRDAQAKAADAQAAKANWELAELKYRDAYVRAPVAGIIETRTVQTGQYVKFGSVLASLIRRDPLLLRFQVPEQDAAPLSAGMETRFTVRDSDTSYTAQIIHVATKADDTTRMVAVTAKVTDKKQAALRPGQFAEVTVPVGNRQDRPVIPQTAIRPTSKGFLAFAVEAGTAKERQITLGLRTADGWVEVKSGLAVGETIVIRGGEALRDGVSVTVTMNGTQPAAEAEKQPAPAAPPAAAPAGKAPGTPAAPEKNL